MKNLLVKLLFVTLTVIPTAISAQTTIATSPFLYKPAENYTSATLDNYTVQDTAHNRAIPIFVRYPANTTGQLPLILWSHGGGPDANGKYGNVEWGTLLARSGYIVIHMSHLSRTTAERTAQCNEFGITDSAQCNSLFGSLEVDRPRDASAVLADLTNIENAFPQIAGRIDRNRIGVAGHSFGSYTAMTLAGGRVELTPTFNDVSFANPLPKVFMALSPQGPGRFGWKENSWREVLRPVLTATGSNDNTPGENAPDRLIAFERMPPTKKYRLFINDPDSTHATFNLNNDARPEFGQWLASYGLAFLDANLKNNQTAQAFLISNRLSLYASRKVTTISRK